MTSKNPEPHGMTGKKNAAKPDSKRVSGDKIFIPMPRGTKSRIIRWRESLGYKTNAAALREWLEKELSEAGF